MKLYEVLLRKVGLWTDTSETQTTAKFASPPEQSIYNPIGSKVGGVVKINNLDYRDYRFTVKSIAELTVGDIKMTDYTLLARPIGQEDVEVRLRVVPNPDTKSRITHRAIVLKLYDELAYDEGLHDVVRSDEKKFVIDDDTDPTNIIHDEFWRVNDVSKSYVATVQELNLVGVSFVEDKTSKMEFWDYSRLTTVDSVEVEEFVFVQMDKESGWFQIWRGSEVIPERIDVF